jgi:hypothetical protein
MGAAACSLLELRACCIVVRLSEVRKPSCRGLLAYSIKLQGANWIKVGGPVLISKFLYHQFIT